MYAATSLLTALLLVSPALAADKSPRYERIPIPVPSGHTVTLYALNDRGQVLGTDCGRERCSLFLWTARTGSRTILDYTIGTAGQPFLNAMGHVALQRSTSAPSYLSTVEVWTESTGWQTVPGLTAIGAFNSAGMILSRTDNDVMGVWTPHAGFYPLVDPPGQRLSVEAMSDKGAVIGSAFTYPWPQPPDNKADPFVWTPGAGLQFIDLPAGPWVTGRASAVNLQGEVAGMVWDAAFSFERRLFLRTPAGATEDAGPCVACSQPQVLNNRREMAGRKYSVPPINIQSYFWSKSTGTREIGSLGGGAALMHAMNDRGEIVGESNTAAGIYHAFVWNLDDGMTDLTPGDYGLGMAVNNDGLVMGWSQAGPCVWSPTHGR